MSATRQRILFVDDEPRILDGISRMLRPQRESIEVLTAGGGEAALAVLAAESIDLVVSDMRMPQMDGAELLATVRQRHPRIVRIILSGQSDQHTIVRATRAAHQFLSKPCSPEELRQAVTHTVRLGTLLPDPTLRGVFTALEGLPSAPGALATLTSELHTGATPERAGRLVAADPGLSAKICQITSTSFFGTPRGLLSPLEAARRLGTDVLRALADGGALPGPACPDFDWTAHAQRSQRVALIARSIAAQIEPDLAPAAETAGLLNTCGRAALACTPGTTVDESSVGSFLLALWGLPEIIVTAIAGAHHPPMAGLPETRLAGILHTAIALADDPATTRVDPAALGLDHLPETWRELATKAGR